LLEELKAASTWEEEVPVMAMTGTPEKKGGWKRVLRQPTT